MTDIWHKMDPWVVYTITVVVPWIVGAALVQLQPNKVDNNGIRTWCFLAVLLVAPIFLTEYLNISPSWKIHEFVDSIACTASLASSHARSAVVYAIAAALPMVILPVSVYWAKVASTVANRKTENNIDNLKHKSRSADYQQAALITFIIRTFVVVYIGFGVLNRVGVNTGGLLELTAVFSVGISWSMRDWLASTWAGLVLACTTQVTAGCSLRLAIPLLSQGGNFKVMRLGTLFVECESELVEPNGKAFRYYLPNNMLTQNGFAVRTN
jgi:hypothetical protein